MFRYPKIVQMFDLCASSTRYLCVYRKRLNKHEKFVNVFMTLGDLQLTNEIMNITEEFTCHLCGYTKQINIHEVIKIHFQNKTKPKPSKKPLNCIKCIEPTTFSPSKDVSIQHIKQSWFVAKL